MAEALWDFFPEIAFAFGKVSSSALSYLSREEFDHWVLLGKKIFKVSSDSPDLCIEYFHSSPEVLAAKSFYHLKGWAEQGIEIAKRSPLTALSYFQITPTFLKNGDVFYLRPWGETTYRS